MSIILTRTYPNPKFQEINVTKFPLVIITDTHTNLTNIKLVRKQRPNSPIVCLGDITFLFAEFEDPSNELSVNYFIDNKIPCLQGNHDSLYDKYDFFKPQKDYLKNLPSVFRLVLPSGFFYLCYHNEPDDLWCHRYELTEEEFVDTYPVDNPLVLGVICGHLHKSFIVDYPNIGKKRICVGQLCNSNHHTGMNDDANYALLTEKGIEFKKL
jgi:predicted phosphodiesterase